jgi:hypothetical protein
MRLIADIRKLVNEDSVKLDHVVKRSRTLRQYNSRIDVPESLFDHAHRIDATMDTEPIVKLTKLVFDHGVSIQEHIDVRWDYIRPAMKPSRSCI